MITPFSTDREIQALSWTSTKLRKENLERTREFVKGNLLRIYKDFGESTSLSPVVEYGSVRTNLPWISESEFLEIRPQIRYGDWEFVEELEDSGEF